MMEIVHSYETRRHLLADDMQLFISTQCNIIVAPEEPVNSQSVSVFDRLCPVQRLYSAATDIGKQAMSYCSKKSDFQWRDFERHAMIPSDFISTLR
jgi:hypothetical protein